MKKFNLVFMITLLVLSSNAMAQGAVDEIDLEVVSLLSLNDQEAVAYSAIMQRQRALYRTLKPSRWEQQLAFYEETFARLKPVLSAQQHVRFVAYMDSFIEAIPEQHLLAMD
jgi:hypothetical protein